MPLKHDRNVDDLSALNLLDPLLDHRLRLAACVLMSRADALTFSRLKELLGSTDGNLGAHLRRLEDARYVEVRKEFQQRRPVSWYRLTDGGRQALAHHVSGLRAILQQAHATGATKQADGDAAEPSDASKDRTQSA